MNFKKSDFTYTPLFCEENIWHLANSLIQSNLIVKNGHILFLTNSLQQIALLNQQSAPLGEAVIWDYHVILQATINNQSLIFDFDSRLTFPCSQDDYFKQSFPSSIKPAYQTMVRAIPSSLYLEKFESDRSHMLDHLPQSEFPKEAIIRSESKSAINLKDLLNITKPITDCHFLINGAMTK